MKPMPRRPASGDSRSGVVLIITVIVVLIAWALVAQLSLGTRVAWQAAKNHADRVRLEAACLAVAEQLFQALADDAAGVDSIGGFGGAAAEEALASLGADSEGEADPGEEESPDTASSDSRMDAWARPMRVVMGDIQVTTWVQDENSKYNLLALVSEDEEARREAREIVTRILDHLREDFDDDLDSTEARLITDEIVEWLEASNRDEVLPRAPRFSDLEDSEEQLMLDLDELLLLESIDEKLYYDQLRDEDRIAPGLETVFTVWTSLGLAAPETAAEAPDGSGEGETAGGEAGAEGASGAEAAASAEEIGRTVSGGLQGALEGDPPIGNLININTAPRAVLLGLVDPSLVNGRVIEEILEYRNEIDEEALAEDEEVDPDLLELERALYGTEEQIPYRFFGSLEDLSEIGSFERLAPRAQEALRSRVGVQSDVFSLYLYARIPPPDWRPEERYEEPIGPVLRLRAVVWRRSTEDGARFIPILPWHEVPYTRWTIPDFQDDLQEFRPPEYF